MTLLIDESAWTDRAAGVVVVSGPDRLTYLHTLLSQHLEGAQPGTAADFLYLDAKGAVLAIGRALVRADDVVLVTPPEVAADLAAALEKYKFMLQISAADVSDTWALASLRGPAEVAVTGAPREAMTLAEHAGGMVVRDRSGGIDLVGPKDWVAAAAADLTLPRASATDWKVWRIQSGLPEWGTEVVPGRRAQELGMLPTHVHLRKGCYPGQESIAKIYNLGRPRRALAVVDLRGPVEAGAVVQPAGGGTKHGEVTSAAPLDDGTVALALLPVDRSGEFIGGGDVVADEVTGRVRTRVGKGLPQPGAPDPAPVSAC